MVHITPFTGLLGFRKRLFSILFASQKFGLYFNEYPVSVITIFDKTHELDEMIILNLKFVDFNTIMKENEPKSQII